MRLFTKNGGKALLTIIFLVSIVYWVFFLQVSGYEMHPWGIYTQLPFIVIPILGAIMGLTGLKKRKPETLGGIVSVLSSALLLFGIGTAIWTYYSLIGREVPYPSVADFIYVWSPVLWIIGFLWLAQLVGGPLGLRSLRDWMEGLVITMTVAGLSYLLLVVYAHGNLLSAPDASVVQLFFDYAYTFGAMALMVIVAMVWSFSYRYLKGKYWPALKWLSFGFIAHFIAIVFFVSTVSQGTYFHGNIADLFFTIAVYLEAMGVVSLKS